MISGKTVQQTTVVSGFYMNLYFQGSSYTAGV